MREAIATSVHTNQYKSTWGGPDSCISKLNTSRNDDFPLTILSKLFVTLILNLLLEEY